MADKKITDFVSVSQLEDDDVLLVGTQNGTYNIKFSDFENNVKNGIVERNQGAENATKELVVGIDGYVTLRDRGGGSVEPSDVNFYDYDGTLVTSYTAEEFAVLSSLPTNPNHAGLTSQGWNWSFEDAKAYVTKYGKLNVGQMYITDDGKTRIYIHLEKGRTSPMLGVCPNGTVDVDWGDGTAHDTLTGTSTSTVKWTSNHSYAAPGDYIIALTVTGSIGFFGNSTGNRSTGILADSTLAGVINFAYSVAVRRIEVGSGAISIGTCAFFNCRSLSSITIPNTITYIGTNAFQNCSSLSSITLPNNLNSISGTAFQDCRNLSSVAIPKSVTSIKSYAFNGCLKLTSVTIPDGLISIEGSVFQSCRSLSTVIIADSVKSISVYAFSGCSSLFSITLPNDITDIGNAFENCSSLFSITLPNKLNSISGTAFRNCYNLSSVVIPESVTSIGIDAFRNCYNLSSVAIPESVTSIGDSAFYNCESLSNITVKSNVENIGSSVFYGCYSIAEYHILPTTPPTLASSVFTGIASDCIIYVPYSADHSILEAYKNATNWSAYASYMQEEPQ